MASFPVDAVRPEEYARFAHPTPQWYADAKFGVFVHWGPYSVPAWAEPIGPLGAFDPLWWNMHNPYAEWYYNTIRIEGSPARQHQLDTYGDLDYERFIDLWKAEEFDAGQVMDVVKASGARYFVPTTKHHDGVTLWDAPGTGDRNTVRRGPRRDLIGQFHDAAIERGIHFGVYYSGGLDWHFSTLPPITAKIDDTVRPRDAAYATYAFTHVMDLIDTYHPEVLWNDIEWPDAGKQPGPASLIDLFDHFYEVCPHGVVNDRWGLTHWDFRTSEYVQGLELEKAGAWENDRGVGFSFGYNTCEDESHYLSGEAGAKHLVDVVSRGGNFLLNIGLTAAGTVPALQEKTLREMGEFNTAHEQAIFGSRPVEAGLVTPSDEPWLRWTATDGWVHAFIESPTEVVLPVDPDRLDVGRAVAVGAATRRDGGDLLVQAPTLGRISFPLK